MLQGKVYPRIEIRHYRTDEEDCYLRRQTGQLEGKPDITRMYPPRTFEKKHRRPGQYGGLTVLMFHFSPNVGIRMKAVCSYSDQFSRVQGRSWALGRLMAYIVPRDRVIVSRIALEAAQKWDTDTVRKAFKQEMMSRGWACIETLAMIDVMVAAPGASDAMLNVLGARYDG